MSIQTLYDCRVPHRSIKSARSFLVAFLVPLLFALGCADTPEKLHPVTGTVTVGGKPMNGGTVQFEMVEKGESGKVYTSGGAIDETGRFELKTFGEMGAPAGSHKVWVVPNFAAMPDKLGVDVRRVSKIPREYMTPVTTDLICEVVEGENDIMVEVPGG